MIFGRGRRDRDEPDEPDEDEEEELEYVLFQGALNGIDPNMKENARLAQAGLQPAKELVTDAILRRAERVRVEPKGEKAVVAVYIDGVPYSGGGLSKQKALAVTQMLKLLCGLDIKERSKPQKGGVRGELSGNKYILDVETAPMGGGAERLFVSVRNPKATLNKPEELGFPEPMRAKIREMGSGESGAILVCGPPGSGTTTTTFGVMRTFDAYMYSLFSIADLGGRDLHNVTQFEPNPGDSLEATVIRMKRQEAHLTLLDPIRNADTAKEYFELQKRIPLVAEFTARDAPSGILQLIQWVGDPKIVAAGLSGLISHKLIRLLCSKCREAFRPHPKLLSKVGLPPETKVLYRAPKPPTEEELAQGFEEPEPCEKCGDIRYIGRTGLFEVIEMTDAMRELVAKGPTLEEIKSQMRKEGMQTLQKEGLRLVAEGKTSLEELQRIFKAGT